VSRGRVLVVEDDAAMRALLFDELGEGGFGVEAAASAAEAMARVHAGLGIDSPAAVREAVALWQRANPKGARGANPCALADYGLDEADVVRAFGDYSNRFAIPREAEGLERN